MGYFSLCPTDIGGRFLRDTSTPEEPKFLLSSPSLIQIWTQLLPMLWAAQNGTRGQTATEYLWRSDRGWGISRTYHMPHLLPSLTNVKFAGSWLGEALECCSPYTTVPWARFSRHGHHAPGGGLPGFPNQFLPQDSRPPVPNVLVNRDGKQLETGDDRSFSRGLNHAVPAAKQPAGRQMIQWKRDTALGGPTYLYHSHCHAPPIPPYKPTSEVFVPVRAEKKHVFKKKKNFERKFFENKFSVFLR